MSTLEMDRKTVGIWLGVIGILALAAAVAAGIALWRTPKIAYVDTGRLMVAFSEASKVEKELKTDDAKWREQLKVLQDSLRSAIDTMSKYFDGATSTRKKELQDNLSGWNQRVNNFRSANEKRMQGLQAEKMKGVIEKANVYIKEYGKKHGYSIIFGTAAGGSIVYGRPERYDITDDVIDGLNERYQ